ncbi:RNA polymerase alpha subunit [Sesbania bispinosa]|nr:RNA polymerase alpha subunit [Sesbania bispinosa]
MKDGDPQNLIPLLISPSFFLFISFLSPSTAAASPLIFLPSISISLHLPSASNLRRPLSLCISIHLQKRRRAVAFSSAQGGRAVAALRS